MTLSILVVEDDGDKLRRILASLTKVEGLDGEATSIARDCLAAKKLLREKPYDLVILDIALPDTPEMLPTPDGGLRLLQEVLDRSIYHRPREVVGLTAFPEVRETAGPQFAEDLWQVLQYDSTSMAWSEQLQRKVRHLQLASRPNVNIAKHEKYLCVLTALQVPEFEAVCSLPWNLRPMDQGIDGTIYHVGKFEKSGETREVVAACAPRMGIAAASALATKMICTFRPRYLAMAGIAAGIRAECDIGDILLADPVWDWGSGKIASVSGVQTFYQAPHQIGTNSFVRGKAALMAADGEALDAIRRRWIGQKPNTPLRMHIRPMASGAAVLADEALVSGLKTQHRKLTGIDMESYGVYSAAEEAPLPQPSVFSIKSICDYADEKKNDDFQGYAAYTSAEALRLFVEKYL